MRNLISIVENITRTKDKTGVSFGNDLSSLFNTAPSAVTANVLSNASRVAARSPQTQAIAAQSTNMLADLERISGDYEDDYQHGGYGDVEPKDNDNLPAVIRNDVVDQSEFNPTWHMVGNLPGMVLNGIRMVVSKIFGEYTRTPLAEIRMMTNVFGINDEADVRKMMSLIRQHGVKHDNMDYDFSEHMPWYQAMTPDNNAQFWTAFDHGFFIMKDIGGYYIYTWPSSDTITTKAIEN